jgi:hypothetical protein
VDVTAGDSQFDLDKSLLKDPVKDRLKRFGLFEEIGEAYFFATIGAAVDAYAESHMADVDDAGHERR